MFIKDLSSRRAGHSHLLGECSQIMPNYALQDNCEWRFIFLLLYFLPSFYSTCVLAVPLFPFSSLILAYGAHISVPFNLLGHSVDVLERRERSVRKTRCSCNGNFDRPQNFIAFSSLTRWRSWHVWMQSQKMTPEAEIIRE
jgi:hypothetical protein